MPEAYTDGRQCQWFLPKNRVGIAVLSTVMAGPVLLTLLPVFASLITATFS